MSWMTKLTTAQLMQSACIKVANLHGGLSGGTSVPAARMADECTEIAAIFAEIARREAAGEQ